MPLTLQDFVRRWRTATLSERSSSQSHFNQLCEVLHVASPTESDQSGDTYCFDKHVSKSLGGKGFADVWKKDHFAWEYKAPERDLQAAYAQLLHYREDLGSPPLLVVSDLFNFEVHTNFTYTKPQVYRFTLDDWLRNEATPACPIPPGDVLRFLFTDPERLHPDERAAAVTLKVADKFLQLSQELKLKGADRPLAESQQAVAHFIMRLLFCLFADSIGLLPDGVVRQAIHEGDSPNPLALMRKLRALFAAMKDPNGVFGPYEIKYFNGGLFEDDAVLTLNHADMAILRSVANYDWSAIEPAIFGNLFERIFRPDNEKERVRTLIGAHYTSSDDILTLIEPVIMAPLRRQWDELQATLLELAARRAQASGLARDKISKQMAESLSAWFQSLSSIRILDPACGSGNFLYVAIRELLTLWEQADRFAGALGFDALDPRGGFPTIDREMPHPRQLFGIEIDPYAHELASVVVWIGYLQWRYHHGYGWPKKEPILEKLTNIQLDDAILRYSDAGSPYEPQWPAADYIVGNPPFLGGKMLRRDLGDKYVDDLFLVYDDRVPAEADLVTYWFEKARAVIEKGTAKRAGLIGTQGIRGGANRIVLQRILKSGGIFFAVSDREWMLAGANVHISMIGFDDGIQEARVLDGLSVVAIHSNLSSLTDITAASRLAENAEICFMGTTKVGAFDLKAEDARRMLGRPLNGNGRPNSDVVKPWINAMDVTRKSRGMYIIDFGTSMTEQEAAQYEWPFEYLKKHVKRVREGNNRRVYAERWWIHGESRPELRVALKGLDRYVVTPGVAKHRIFAWVTADALPDHALFAFAREDDYFFGVLHSHFHKVWALKTGTALEDRPRYTPTTTFETFPLPWPPGKEPVDNDLLLAISTAAKRLAADRANDPEKRTLTDLYNKPPQWLLNAHAELDRAVAAAYGWPDSLSDQEILSRLLALNAERAVASVCVIDYGIYHR